ncbi:FAD-dependent oxidoreductase [Alcaligenaceae bacterium]|nr:FAD-dependent oxidoreductase [Alcaligenaceae bacterium]
MDNTLLFQPFQLGGLTLRNRIIMAPMETNLASPQGEVTPEMIAYYAERSAGGVGMVTVEFTCVDRSDGLGCTPQLSLDAPQLVPGHRRLVAAIQAGGARACLQLHHAGRQTTPAIIGGRTPIAPSTFESPVFRIGPRAMDDTDIKRVITAFAAAASHARSAGYDAVELHGAHGYLLGQFLSPWTNRRNDAWGGSFKRRLAFPLAVIHAVKARIGAMPLIYRLSADEMIDGGLGIEDTVLIAPHFAQAGVDALHVSTGVAERIDVNVEPIHMPDGWRLPLARQIRQAVKIPVIGVGVIRTPATANQALERGDIDLVALGRALLTDPQWPNKALAGVADQIRPCTSCNWCIDRLAHQLTIGCAENPRAGRELDLPLGRIAAAKNAVVIGGGPGGMKAALLLAESGFSTTLYEKRNTLGGGLIASAVPPGKDKIFRYRDYLLRQISSSAVTVRLGCSPTALDIAAHAPDIVILATGASKRPADIPGGQLAHVAQAYDVVMHDIDIGPGPIVVLGGGETGCEVAELAAAQGAQVVLVSRSPLKQLARAAEAIYRRHLVKKLAANPLITILPSATILRIEPDCVQLHLADDNMLSVPAAQVFTALGRDTGSPLISQLQSLGINVAIIGDAQRISRIGEAVNGAYTAVREHIKRHARVSQPGDPSFTQ